MSLTEKKCMPCEGGIPPLEDPKIQEYLKEVTNWSIKEGKLHRDFKFKNFKEAIDFINKIADLAEKENHHPDFTLHSWNKVSVTLYTHVIKGLSENDFILAAKINFLGDF